MRVYIEKERKTIELERGPQSVAALLEQLGLKRAAVLVAVNGKLVPDDATLKPKDNIEIFSAISGG